MKQLIFVLLIMTLGLTTNAQYFATPYKDDNNKWGLVDADGKFTVKPHYTDMDALGNGKFLVAEGGKINDGILTGEKWGVISENGEIILKTEYDEIGDFINGGATITKGGKIGFINKDYKIITSPKYDFVGSINAQGLVWVNEGGKEDKQHPGYISNGKFGVINISGNIIIPISYKAIGYICEAKYYHDYSKIYNAKSEMDRLMLECGSQNALWAKQIELKPGSMLPSETIGLAFSNKQNLTHNGISDLNGKVLVKENLYQRCAMPTDGLALVLTKKNQTGYHDITTGKFKTKESIRSAFSFNGSKSIILDSKNKWIFCDKNLSQIGQSYDWISPKIGLWYIVRNEGRMSLLDSETLDPIVTEMEYIYPPKDGHMAYKDTNTHLWGFMNEQGLIVLPAQFEYAYSFNHGAAVVKSADGWGIINTDLKECVPTRFTGIVFPTSDGFKHIWVSDKSQNNMYKCWHIDSNGFAFDKSFNEVWNFIQYGDEEIAIVRNGDKFGQIDNEGNIIVPIEYESKSIVEDALLYRTLHRLKEWQPIHTYRYGAIRKNQNKTYTIKDILPNENWDY